MWKKAEFSKKEISKAGQKIVDPNITEEEYNRCIEIVDNWRAAHAYPMHVFAINLRRKVVDIDGAVVVRRLKRLDTICKKLERNDGMQLHRMQDLGGCRVIVPTIADVYEVERRIEASRIRHEQKNKKDYICNPNPHTGYRSLHLIYKYKSEKNLDYNGMLVEIQIRTKLQHLWATAVETVGLFTGNGLKFNQGSDEWLQYFKLISALFAIKEGTPVPEGVPTSTFQLIENIIELEEKIEAIDKMRTIGLFAESVGHVKNKKFDGYYLLILDTDKKQLRVIGFAGMEKGLEEATKQYNEIERTKGDRAIDAVLVGAQSYESLVDAYPNYFANISEFINTVLALMQQHIELFQKQIDAAMKEAASV